MSAPAALAGVSFRYDAPELHVETDVKTERWLLQRYEDWRQHYHECAACNAGSWQEPDFVTRPCRNGKLRFQAWARLACALSIPK